MNQYILLSIVLSILSIQPALGQGGQYVQINDDVELYYEERGAGTPLIFIPGWTMTTAFFEHQLAYFSRQYRVITIDPRSQGRSSKTLENNTYAQHASDLAAFMEALDLEDVVLAGWSSGAHTLYAYIRAFSLARIKALVFIDETPKWIGDTKTEWVYGTAMGYKSSIQGILHDRRNGAAGIARWMVERPLNDEEVAWMVDEMMKTPTHAAFMLYVDSLFEDYMPEARAIDGQVPVLYMLRESWLDQARRWLDVHAPNAEILPMNHHAMFWERPDAFNAALEIFLVRVQ